MAVIVCFALGYVCGSFLTADVVMRARTGESAFSVGSGNPGMANVGAQLGVPWAVVVLAGDIAKTILAVALGAWACTLAGGGGAALLEPVVGWPWSAGFPHAGAPSTLLAGLGAVVGHDFPFWHRFRGGKGVTATCSAIILFSPLLGCAASVIGLAAVVATRKRSLGGGALAIPAAFLAGSLLARMPAAVLSYAALLLALSAAVWVRGRA